MHISRVRARGFKRFHDLTIEIPNAPRLVVMCGPNGLGKSSVFDALRLWHGGHRSDEGWREDASYHRKTGEPAIQVNQMVEVDFVEGQMSGDPRKLIYVRTAYRHEPDFQTNAIQRAGEVLAAPRAYRMIDSETKVSDNYQRLVAATFDDVFSGRRDAMSVGELRDSHIGLARDAMLRLFPELELQGPGDPIGGGTFYFRKSGRAAFHYKNLSGGEKAAFDLVLDLVIKTTAYDDTVFCLDEPELHLNTRLQGPLLQLLLDLTPATGQLWIATHSIGMMRKAQDLFEQNPSDVAFLDVEGQDFDQAVTLTPVPPSREFWNRVLKVALDDLADLVAPDRVVLCEGRPLDAANVAKAEFDARCYRRIFASDFPRTDFVSVGNALDVLQDRVELGRAIQTLVSGTVVVRVVDRDLRSEQELQDLQKTGTRVLTRRQLESYLLDRDVIQALCESVGHPEKCPDVLAALDKAVSKSVGRGNDHDDMKSAAGEFYVAARQMLALTSAGSTTEAFLADTLAPLLKPGMPAYSQLRSDLFGA
jgi:predicted ATPase